MNGRATIAGLISVGGVGVLGYMLASDMPFNHELTYFAILAGFIICDRSFWPKRKP